MKQVIGTYDTDAARNINLDRIIGYLNKLNVKNIYVKKLAPNDNSKNQPYFGSHLTDLSFIPTGEIVASETASNKIKVKKDNKRRIKFQASVKLSWLDSEGLTYSAPNTKLIYYPQYPEVRFSGFLKGSRVNASRWMDPKQEGRSQGRWLILGVAEDENVYAYLATRESALSKELETTEFFKVSSVFGEINSKKHGFISTRGALITKLLEIHEMGWIPGQKLSSAGVKEKYEALNAGGYTLEAELGVKPNGVAEPDFLGWEVKQFGVKAFPAKGTTPTTLMTPEPNGGFYIENGAKEFVRKYGYPDKSGKSDRFNFGGKHQVDKVCSATNLTMKLIGFDRKTSSITDAQGVVALIDSNGDISASWSFAKLMDHWKRKHAQAVYVPCMSRPSLTGGKEYHYGKDIELGMGTNFEMILTAMAGGYAYYDPGIKLENASTSKPKIKKRNQFRINHKELYSLYKNYEFVDIKIVEPVTNSV
ncbi:MAG: MvaI/BcnI family restriction endonuclease [Saprospiraceae bacterium]|jgi:hypothetical protein|nr:MvaI/BcnI family restriction endonuclease [Saprospiraceae bacterium]